MVRGRPLEKSLRALIVKKYCQGKKIREISEELNLAKSTVADIISHYRETGGLDVKGKSSGRPKLVSERSQRLLVKLCKKNRRNTLRDITAQWTDEIGHKLSRECCRKWIHKSGLSFYKVIFKFLVYICSTVTIQAKEKPLITVNRKKNRYNWAKSKLAWTMEDWSKVIFSDESKFDVCVGDLRRRVIRSKSEAFNKDCLKRTVKFPKGIMVWGACQLKGWEIMNWWKRLLTP